MQAVTPLLADLRAVPGRWARSVDGWLLGPVDARVYALVRISFALASLAVLIDLWPDRIAYFADDGLVGRGTRAHPLSLFHLPGVVGAAVDSAAIGWIMGVSTLALVLLALGIWRRPAALVALLWNLSYSTEAYPANSGFDAVLRVVGFVVLIAPDTPVWSLAIRGRARTESASGEVEVSGYGLRLLQWQLAVLYLATVWLKAPDAYWRGGEMFSYFLMSMYARWPDPAWADLGQISVVMSWGSLLCETAIPFLLWSRSFRVFGFVVGAGLHLGIGLSAKLGLFSFSMIPLYAAFLTRADLRWWARRLPGMSRSDAYSDGTRG